MIVTSKAWLGHARRMAFILAAGAAVLTLEPVTPLHIQAEAQSREQSVVVRGNRRIEVETILSYMNLREGQTVTAEDLNRAVRTLFDTGLFRDVQIIPSENQLIVEVIENPSINKIAFEGEDSLSEEDLEQIISLRPRLPFTVSAAEADAQAIIEVYRRTGRYGAEVEPVIIERSDNRVDLVFEISEGELTEVSSIDFVGNKVFSDRRLRSAIETSEAGIFSSFFSTDVYDPDRLELDKELLRNYYFERGYADFTVLSATAELTPDREGFFITFTVSEGEPYTFGEITNSIEARGLDAEPLIAAIPTDLTGETYDATEVQDITNEMADLASQQGFAFVQVRPRPRKNAEERTIDIDFNVVEGPRVFIERIDIEGNSLTLDRVIRRNIDLAEGDAFDSRKIREARAKIRALRYFSRVEIENVEGSAPDRQVLKVKVQEQSTGSLSFGIGFSTSAGPIGNVSIEERNFLGRGQFVEARVNAAGDTQDYRFEFREPAFLDRDLSLGFRAFFTDSDFTDEANYEIGQIGFSPFVEFPLSEDTRIELRYEARRDDIKVNTVASPALQADNGVRLSSIFGYTVTHDQRNDVVEPTAGYLLTFRQDFAGAGGDARYARSIATGKTWTSFFNDEVVASLEIEGGALASFGKDSVVNERFSLGGDSLRGFGSQGVGPRDPITRDALGGNFFGATRLEVSFPIGLPDELNVYGGVFVDAGTLFSLDGTRVDAAGNVIDDGMNFRVGAGALLFVPTPFGPLEMSFGVPLLKEDLDESEFFRLQIGTRF